MAVFLLLEQRWEHPGKSLLAFPLDTRIARFLLVQLMTALRSNVPDPLAMGSLPCLLLLGLPCQMNTFPE